jgi:protease-4
METFSRDSMSEADREQRQRIIDVIYETTRAGVMEGRGISEAEFDGIVDDRGLILPGEALDLGLVDAVARWNNLGEHLRGEKIRLAANGLGDVGREYWDEQWGMPAVIPVVYAVGPCAMDSGIKGRKTSAYLRRLAKDPYVKAVVLRADSPGGDPLPSDLVAEAVLMLRKAGKPVIISQGDVAASGGYWISMDGSEILTTPLTVTGSIGVIGGWMWDDGLTGKMGITSDVVQRGKHADLFGTVNLPFLGGIPARPMNESELARAEKLVRATYEDFLDRVAAGRGMTREEVHAVAQGRVWMGGDALEHGLVDRIGTLDQAIHLALDRAGIPDWRQVEIREYPPRPPFAWPSFGPEMPGFFGLGDAVNGLLMKLSRLEEAEAALMSVDPFVGAPGLTGGEVDYLRSVADRPGEPILALPPDHLPEAWQDVD